MAEPAASELDGFDQTWPLLREGYEFISRRCDRLGSDIFRCRLVLSPVLCARGSGPAEMVYGGDRFTRRGALPPTVLWLLQDIPAEPDADGAAQRPGSGQRWRPMIARAVAVTRRA